ncbi:hypothetical protein AGLY_011219 [Aphis glycines]|uniref:Uncharacterized protein n=1 Tax=Aphis glycines TaxID=307491 RepID=A0A6G0TF21_APHGL|nr:hypothetical protein AGLY_011219 [Aphis glycines]
MNNGQYSHWKTIVGRTWIRSITLMHITDPKKYISLHSTWYESTSKVSECDYNSISNLVFNIETVLHYETTMNLTTATKYVSKKPHKKSPYHCTTNKLGRSVQNLKMIIILKILGNLILDEIACEAYDTHYIYNHTKYNTLHTQLQDYHRFLGNRLLKVLLARKHLMCRTT